MLSPAIKMAYIRIFFSLYNFIALQNVSLMNISKNMANPRSFTLCNVIFV